MNELKPLLDKFDQDIRDHKKEVREQIAASESRQIILLKEIRTENKELIKEIRAENKEREERFLADGKEREERFLANSKERAEQSKETERHMFLVLSDIKNDVRSSTKHIQALVISTITALIAIFAAIAIALF